MIRGACTRASYVATAVACWTAVATWIMVGVTPLAAQEGAGASFGEAFAGSEMESYLRVLQVGGVVSPYPWSIRAFSPPEVDRLLPADSVHPWSEREQLRPDTSGGLQWRLLRPEARLIFNSAYPHGGNDGPLWTGRGLTTAVQAGVAARYGPLSLVLAPTFFWAQNAAFEMRPNGYTGPLAFGDARYPERIDLPQRFGDDAYARVDAGQSTLRLDLPVVTVGISSANQQWGPMADHPILLGTNAPGFLHGFLGTSAPLNVWIGRVHGRMVWGRLEQSEYSPVQQGEARRFMSGVVGTFTPRGIPGLELGGARFFHEPWPEGGPGAREFLKPIESFWKRDRTDAEVVPGDPKSDVDNQLASAFFRWVLPRSGFEFYGEYGREDHNWDWRDFVLEPDNNSGYAFGGRRVWQRSNVEWIVLRGEVLNLRPSHLGRVRSQWPFYVHGWTIQGHTHHGQLLGSPAGYGGAGSVLAVDVYQPDGRWTLAWSRDLRQPAAEAPETSGPGADVVHSLSVERLFFHGPFEVTTRLAGALDFNRNFVSDRFNLNAGLTVRAGL